MQEVYTALVVEDVKDTSDYIRQRIEKLCPAIKDIQQAFSIQEAYDNIISRHFDIIFLDIQLPKGTGFDLLRRLSDEGKIDFEIIFITGESAKEFTLRAIKYSALDFLYKPLDDTDLIHAVNKATDKLKTQYFNRQIKLLLDRVGGDNLNKTNKIALHLHNGIVEFVNVDEIKYLEADGVVAYVYLNNGDRLTTTRNLGYYKEMLMMDYNFYPISNSLLVNQEYILRYNHKELQLTLNDGTVLFASKRFGKSFKDTFSNQNQNRPKVFKSIANLWRKMLE
ncbi:LytR/AlgR family response regulator transcription factor [Marinifilum sp.]|uniref:LytR/AlgR family response regulator transcription factor n=1 Tax=Marinifilum sp. TaxID=2033137 RepID=UPI003BAC665B